jgi:hypothetical protein
VLQSDVVREGAREQSRRVGRINARDAALMAWSACLVSLTLTALSLLLLALNLSHPDFPIYPYWAEGTLLAVGYTTVGAVVASRRPQNPIGWILCSIGLLWGVDHFNSEYAIYTLLAAPGTLPGGEVAAWLTTLPWVLGLGLFVFMALLFPNGQLLSSRWRPFAWFSVLLVAVGTIMSAISPGPILGLNVPNPLGIEGLPNVYEQLQGLMFALIFVASASLLVRLHHARGVERQQIKWVAYAGALAASASLLNYTAFEAMDVQWLELFGRVPALVGILGIPTAVGIAILRYRLYEIDTLINRTLVYGLLTVLLAALYFGGVAITQVTFRALTGQEKQPQLAIVISTLVIAALFNPLRRRIQGFIDRRFYRSKYDARKTLETFSAKLRDETDLDVLCDDLVDVVRDTMQPAHVSLWLQPRLPPRGSKEQE